MSDLKNKLIKLGSENPELQENIRPVLDLLSKTAANWKSLQKDLEKFLENKRKDTAVLESDQPSDMLRDVQVIINKDMVQRILGNSTYEAALIFDGDGYDYFSHRSMAPRLADRNREQVRKIAQKNGYDMEVASNTAIGFYPVR